MASSSRRALERAGTLLGIGGLVALGVVWGIDLWIVTIPALALEFVFFEGVVTVGAFTLFAVCAGTFVVRGVWRPRDADLVRSGPLVEAVVPAYRDAVALSNSVETLLATEYEPLDVTIVVEPNDWHTGERARALADEHDRVSCLVNGEPGSKATAINFAIAESDAGYFAVFDADERVAPDFIPGAMGALLDGTDVFQGRRVPRPTGPIETLAYCERIVVDAGYAVGELLGFTHCQSSSTAFTRAAFEAVGGYDDRLTEDIDFSHKVFRANQDVTKDRRYSNTMEAPHTLRDFWGQRKRWRIGHVQVVHARIRDALAGKMRAADVLSIGRAIGGLVGGAFLLFLSAQILLLFLLDIESALFVPYLAVIAVIGAIWGRDVADGTVAWLSWTVFFVPVVFLGHGVLTVKAVLEYLLTWNGEWYRVTKTGN